MLRPFSFKKDFRVIEADQVTLSIADWQLETPAAGSCDPLNIILPKVFDHVSLTTLIHVVDYSSEILSGDISLLNHETVWQFTPTDPWQFGTYQLMIAPWMEDITGNSFYGLFDRPSNQNLDLSLPKVLSLKFTI